MVKVRPDETLEQLIARFKSDVKSSGVLQECKDREFYLKPGAARRKKIEDNARARAARARRKRRFN